MRIKNFKKIAVATLALTMCFPGTVFAASTPAPTPVAGEFTTTFDVYSPVLNVKFPTTLDLRVNPLADSTDSVAKYTFASDSIDIVNGSVDYAGAAGIPINVRVYATIETLAADVVAEYNDFTASSTSPEKKIYMTMAEATTSRTIAVANSATPEYTGATDAEKKLNLTKYALGATPAAYNNATNKVTVTQWGSMLSVDIAKPVLATGSNKSYQTAGDVTPTVGSFAVIGTANTGAKWAPTDVKVKISYDVRACKALTVTTPTVTPVTWASGSSANDLTIAVSGCGEETVLGMGLHNGAKDTYGSYLMAPDKDFTVTYSSGTATIKVSKTSPVLAFLAGDAAYKGKAQDLAIALSDGRVVVTKLTVTAN